MTRWEEPAQSTLHPSDLDTAPFGSDGTVTAVVREPRPPPSADELGRGAGGTVLRGPDRHLPRTVAWKVATGAAARKRLQHEARVLASLDHPAILPIHDLVDESATDTLRIALRMVRGETLHTLIRRAETLAERLRLLRPFLHAVEAVAWAHRMGWVHRDLKPANIMIGELGETQVIDWGLAANLDEGPPEAPGTVVGTLTTMSPEQARGEHIGPAADVWGLGATLFELVAGAPLYDLRGRGQPFGPSAGGPWAALRAFGRRPWAALRAFCRGPWAALRAFCRGPKFEPGRGPRPGAPRRAPEARRHLPRRPARARRHRRAQPRPARLEDRYPDAAALASDLAAYLDGRPVHAHDYSARELLVRFIRAWRLPLGIALAVLVTGVVAFTVAFREISAERDEAVRARQEALAAVAERGVVLALRELADGQRPEAELAAAQTLEVRESPEARGVIMAFARTPRFERTWKMPLAADCIDIALAPDGRRALCGSRDALSMVGPDGPLWTWPSPYAGVSFSDGGRSVLIVDSEFALTVLDATDGHTLRGHPATRCKGLPHPDPTATFVLNLAFSCADLIVGGDRIPVDLCGGHIEAAAVDRAGRIVAVCPGGDIVARPQVGTSTRRPSAIGLLSDTLLSAAVVDAGHLVVGTSGGQLWLVDIVTGAIVARRQLTPVAPIHAIEASASLGLVVARVEGQGPLVLRAATLVPLGRLPRAEGRYTQFIEARALTSGPPSFDLVTYSDKLSGWSTHAGAPAQLDGLGGVTWLTPADDDRLLVSHDSSAALVSTTTGALLGEATWVEVIAKSAVLVGQEIKVALAGRASGEQLDAVVTPGDPALLSFSELPAMRRVGLLSRGRMIGSRTGFGIHYWSDAGEPHVIGNEYVADLVVRDDFVALLFGSPRRAALWDASADPVELGACPVQSGESIALGPVAPGASTPLTLVVSPSAVTALDTECAVVARYTAAGSELTRATTTYDGRFVAAGTRAGTVHAWRADDGVLVASVPIHGGPVTTLTTDPHDRWFLSGAWDGRVAFLSINVLDQDRATLVSDIRRAWQR